MISLITLSNDLVTVPIYLVLSNIYLARKQNEEDKYRDSSKITFPGEVPEQEKELAKKTEVQTDNGRFCCERDYPPGCDEHHHYW